MKKSSLFAGIFLILSWLVGLPSLSSEDQEKSPARSIITTDSVFGFKSPLKLRERFQSRLCSDSSEIRWVCSYGTNQNDFLFTIKQAKDGGYLATGKSYGTNNRSADAVLVKINEEGSLEWQKSYGMAKEEAYYPCSVAETSDGGYILATDSVNAGSSKAEDVDILVLKLSSDGSLLWQKTYGRETSTESTKIYARGGIIQTRDGGFFLVGAIVPSETNIASILVLKLDSAGNILWDKIFKAPGLQWGDSVQQTPDGGYIVGGEALGYPLIRSAEKAQPLIFKLDSNGNIEWQKLYEGYGKFSTYRMNIITAQDNGYVVADSVEHSMIVTPWGAWEYNGDFWVFKLDQSGNILWQNLYGGGGWDQAYALCETHDGGYAVAGYTESYGRGSSEGWILKLEAAGNISWQKTYGEKNAASMLFNISQKNNGDFLAAGYIVHAESDMLALNISEDGEIGEGGNWVMDSDAIATLTLTVPINADLTSMNAGLISNLSNASSADYSLTREILCWNLHQPPISVSLKTEINRSLFRKEHKNTLTWQPNPFNDQFPIVEYRIYRKIGNNDYEMIKAVPVYVTEYADELIPATDQSVSYFLTSVDSEGRESPRSASVWY